MSDVLTGLRRETKWRRAHHGCDPDPFKNTGIGGINVYFALTDGERAVTWTLMTGMGLPDDAFREASPECKHPMHQDGYPYGFGPTPGPSPGTPPCRCPTGMKGAPRRPVTWIDVGECYGDSGYSLGDRAYTALAVHGDDALWAFLEEMWQHGFKNGGFPEASDG